MDLLFLCSWVVTVGLCFGSPWDDSKCAFSGAAAAQCHCHNSIPPSMRSCSSTTHGCIVLSLAGWGHSSFQHCVYKTIWWLFHEVLKGSKCAERILRLKRIQKHCREMGNSRVELSWLGSMDCPGRQRESSRNCQVFLLEYPFTDASAVTAGFEYHWTGASAVAVETVGSGCLLAALLQRKECWGELGWAWDSLVRSLFLSHCDLQSLF